MNQQQQQQQQQQLTGSHQTPKKYRRRRPAVSCIACRRRKIKCDRGTPCSQCSKFQIQFCEYAHLTTYKNHTSTSTPSVRSSSSNGNRGKQNARDISSSGIASGGDVLAPPHPHPNEEAEVQAEAEKQSRNPLASSSLSMRYIQSRPSTLDLIDAQKKQQSSSTGSSGIFADHGHQPDSSFCKRLKEKTQYFHDQFLAQNPDSALVRGSISKGRLFGQSHWTNSYEQYDKLVNLRQYLIFNEEIESILKECKSLARITKSGRSALDTLPLLSHVPMRDTADQLVQLYFRTFESTYRILHVPSFFREYNQYWNSPATANPMFIIKLLLVMSIGTCFHKDESLRSLTPHWIQAAQSLLGSPKEKTRLNISGVQIHCLLLLAKQMSFAGDNLNWISAGSCLRLAMNIGFHRDPKYFPKMSPLQAHIRRQLWWTVLELCVQYAFDSGMPALISFNDFDTALPANIADTDIDENTKEMPVGKPEGTYTQASIQLALASSLQIRLSIVSLLNDFKNDLTYDKVLELGKEFTTQLRSQSLLLNGFRVSYGSLGPPTEFQKIYVDLITRRFLLALHLPYTLLEAPDPRYYYSRKVTLDTVMIMCGYTKNPISSSPEVESEEEYFTLLKHRGGGVFRMIMVIEAMAICLENYKQIQEESPLSRDHLHKALAELVDLSRRRVEYGETNVQGYLWISAAKAHIDALETGQPIREAMQVVAIDAMKNAHEILKRKASEFSAAATPVRDLAGEDDFSWEFLMESQDNTESILNTPELWLFSEWGNENGVL